MDLLGVRSLVPEYQSQETSKVTPLSSAYKGLADAAQSVSKGSSSGTINGLTEVLIHKIRNSSLSRDQKEAMIFALAYINENAGGDPDLLAELMQILAMMEQKSAGGEILTEAQAERMYEQARQQVSDTDDNLTVDTLLEALQVNLAAESPSDALQFASQLVDLDVTEAIAESVDPNVVLQTGYSIAA